MLRRRLDNSSACTYNRWQSRNQGIWVSHMKKQLRTLSNGWWLGPREEWNMEKIQKKLNGEKKTARSFMRRSNKKASSQSNRSGLQRQTEVAKKREWGQRQVPHLKKLMSGWRNSPRVPSTHTVTKTHRKILSMTMATYFQSSSTWGKESRKFRYMSKWKKCTISRAQHYVLSLPKNT